MNIKESQEIKQIKDTILDIIKDTHLIDKCIIEIGCRKRYPVRLIVCAGMKAKYVNTDKVVDDLADAIIEHYLNSLF